MSETVQQTTAKAEIRIALVGNPNSGKSSLFNHLTGLKQDIGNYPGVTVERVVGSFRTKESKSKITIVDLPGAYSLEARSEDERITSDIISNPEHPDHPDAAVIVVDATKLKVGLYLCMQVIERGIPCVLALSMMDQLKNEGGTVDLKVLSEELGIPVIAMKGRGAGNEAELKKWMTDGDHPTPTAKWVDVTDVPRRHSVIKDIVAKCQKHNGKGRSTIHRKIDDLATHPILGMLIFLIILTTIFQAVFSWAELPMEWIDGGFSAAGEWLHQTLPSSFVTDLFIDGIWAGLGGVVIFIPQIAFLFFFITLMEESGYMARVSFITDGIMRRMGLNGRSVVPLMSGLACAVPAIMAARMIPNRRERIITIMVTPFMSCAARLPVYALIIALVIPSERLFGVFNYQGLAMTAMYIVGIVASLGVAWILSKTMPKSEEGGFMLELPIYRLPNLRNLITRIITKVSQFVFNAGKVILVISVLLWLGASFGPTSTEDLQARYDGMVAEQSITPEDAEVQLAKERLETSYIGIVGKSIEPVIEPLGYDWKIGIALVTSFAAREVFVGTISTIYSLGDSDNSRTLQERMAAEVRQDGSPLFNLPMGISLLLFYAFAMQCMSTVAIVKSETNSWKMAILQMLGMTALAYIGSLIAFQLLS